MSESRDWLDVACEKAIKGIDAARGKALARIEDSGAWAVAQDEPKLIGVDMVESALPVGRVGAVIVVALKCPGYYDVTALSWRYGRWVDADSRPWITAPIKWAWVNRGDA